MKYIPKKTKKASTLSFFFFLSGFLFFAAGAFTKFRWIGQGVGVILLVCGIQFLVRFVLSEYRYILEYTDDGGCELIVCKRTGKNDIKVCHISMGNVTEVVEREKKKIKADKIYNYCQNLGALGVSVVFEDGDKVCEVILEADKAFTDALRSAMSSADGDMTFAM